MRALLYSAIVASCVLFSVSGFGAGTFAAARTAVGANGAISLQDITITAPSGWRLNQDASSDGTLLLGFSKGTDYVAFYVKQETGLDMNAIFVNGSSVTRQASETHGAMSWSIMELSHSPYALVAFRTEKNGYSYYGYSRSSSAATARTNANGFLDLIGAKARSTDRSLTGPDYTGSKYYFGWGAVMPGDPNEMVNEVTYDVKHTHDIFVKDTGGGYMSSTLFDEDANATNIRNEWARIGNLITANDMYIQYSSGHGSHTGLATGVSYNDVRDNALSYPAKEIVIFTMSCYSGNLVSAFNNKKAQWQDFQSQGRTLFVMASSKPQESSSTGPGTDPAEPGGPDGSAGSAFGHSLWKALAGEADGYVDGVKDGFLSLDEIRTYTTDLTKKIGGHTPVVTGAYTGSLIMNKVPSAEFLRSIEGGTEGLSDDQIIERVRQLDAELRVRDR